MYCYSGPRRTPLLTIPGFVAFALVAMGTTAAFSQTVESDGIIDRRDQARRAYLATQDGVYQKYCAHCHGEDGHGDGRFWTNDLSPKPSDLTTTTLDQEALVGFITDGSSASGRSALCPPWGNTISSQNVERLSWYILAMQGEPSVAAPGPPATLGSSGASAPVPWILAILVEILAIGVLVKRLKDGTIA